MVLNPHILQVGDLMIAQLLWAHLFAWNKLIGNLRVFELMQNIILIYLNNGIFHDHII